MQERQVQVLVRLLSHLLLLFLVEELHRLQYHRPAVPADPADGTRSKRGGGISGPPPV